MKIQSGNRVPYVLFLAMLLFAWLNLSCSNEGKNKETEVAQTAQLKGHLVFYAMPG